MWKHVCVIVTVIFGYLSNEFNGGMYYTDMHYLTDWMLLSSPLNATASAMELKATGPIKRRSKIREIE